MSADSSGDWLMLPSYADSTLPFAQPWEWIKFCWPGGPMSMHTPVDGWMNGWSLKFLRRFAPHSRPALQENVPTHDGRTDSLRGSVTVWRKYRREIKSVIECFLLISDDGGAVNDYWCLKQLLQKQQEEVLLQRRWRFWRILLSRIDINVNESY